MPEKTVVAEPALAAPRFAAADQALYQAKREGRNRVRPHGETGVPK
jgi:GGDEF domain-containing protein